MDVDRREAALSACEALLRTITACPVYRTPTQILGPAEFPAIAMWDGGESIEDIEAGFLAAGTEFAVVLGTRSDAPQDLGSRLNALRAAVLAALGSDPTLDGTVSGVRYRGAELPDYALEDGAAPHATMTLNFLIERHEREFDPFG